MERLLFWLFPQASRQLSWLAVHPNIEQSSAPGNHNLVVALCILDTLDPETII